jgi:membrane peptidoglycan carboxypeptidase
VLANLAKLVGLIVALGVLAAGILMPYVGGAGLAAKAGADKFLNTKCSLTEEPVQQKTTLLASDGKTVIATLFDQNRAVVALSRVPKSVTNALIATEDRRFYEHHGVDVRGLLRGALKTSSGDTQGASTLTEQYVKQVNYYNAITNGDQQAAEDAIVQNLDRKLSDAQCALDLEKKYTKNQILEKYLNIAFFGENAYGIQTAAQTYFGVDVSKLTVPQAALLVGLVQAPTSYDPYIDPGAAKTRRNLVLDNMVTAKNITAAQAVTYKAAPIKLAKQAVPARGCAYANPAILNAGFFCDYAVQWLESTGKLTASRVNTGGLKITTTLNVGMQNTGEQNVWAQGGLDPKNSSGYALVMPSVDPTTGAVTTMITDHKYGIVKNDPSYTVGKIFTDSYSGSGSTYKYFTALAALKSGVDPSFSLTTNNDQWKVRNCPQDYTVHNAGFYAATQPLSTALPASSNTYFVALIDQLFGCDLTPAVTTAQGLGMTWLNANGGAQAKEIIAERRPTFTLGQDPTAVLDLTSAIGTVANDGVFCPPTPIAQIAGGMAITDSAGKPVKFTQPPCTRQYDTYTARTLLNIMTNDTHSGYGTAYSDFRDWYNAGGSLVAAKTGTNNDVTDTTNSALWFVGITPHLVSATAMVNPDNPGAAINNVPGITGGQAGNDTFGAAVSKFWLDAYGPALQAQQWTWPTAADTPGQPVPSVIGLDLNTAQAQLTAAGFKSSILQTPCGSKVTSGDVAYYSPKIADPATTTVLLCASNGTAPYVFVAPVKPSKSASAPSSGASSTTGQPSAGASSSANAHPSAGATNRRTTGGAGQGNGGG